jgi:phospholipid/cholesterol/gamma-HCH transport system permease protein
MITAVVRRTGAFGIERGRSLFQMAVIGGQVLRALARLRFVNRACLAALVRQVDAVAVRSLPAVCATALVLGSVTVHTLLEVLTGLGAYDRIGDYLVDAMLHRIAPLGVALILLLRPGIMVMAEVGGMKVRGELDSLAAMGIPLRDYVFLPRLAAFAVAGPCLTLAFALVGLVGGFLVLGYLQDITWAAYLGQLAEALEARDLAYLTLKPLLMAVCVGLVALQRGLMVRATLGELPALLIRGMLYAVGFIVAWEVFFSLAGW